MPDVDQINLVAFHEAMTAVANYLDAADSAVNEHLSTKREMDSFYATEFGPDWSSFYQETGLDCRRYWPSPADRLSSVAVLRLRDAARVFRVLG